jgi:hypothetical protein
MRSMNLTKLDLFLLSTNLIVFGGLAVLILLRGPSVPSVLLAAGSGLTAFAKLCKAFTSNPA